MFFAACAIVGKKDELDAFDVVKDKLDAFVVAEEELGVFVDIKDKLDVVDLDDTADGVE